MMQPSINVSVTDLEQLRSEITRTRDELHWELTNFKITLLQWGSLLVAWAVSAAIWWLVLSEAVPRH
jgi:hypothetical protein